MRGDVLLARGEADEALAHFRRAYERNPERGVLEEKIGLASLQQDEAVRAVREIEEALDNPELADKAERNPAVAFLLSALLPGAGQMYNTDSTRGLVLFCVALLGFGVMFSAFTSLLAEVRHLPSGRMLNTLVAQAGDWSVPRLLWVMLNALTLGTVWTYSIIEAPLRAARLNREREERLGMV